MKKRYIYSLFLAFLFAQPNAYAETIRGMITDLDAAHDILIVRRTDPSKEMEQQLNIKVKSDTKTKNVASLKELQVGHEVKMDVKEDKMTGIYEAKSIEVLGAAQPLAPDNAPDSTPNGG